MNVDTNTLNLIIIDDNENDIDVATEVLEKFKSVKVNSFISTDLAHNYLKENPDAVKNTLIILDLNLPGKNGFGFLKYLKGNPDMANIPVIIYSSSKRKEDIQNAYTQGASSYIVKPNKIDDIERIFEDIIYYWTNVSLI